MSVDGGRTGFVSRNAAQLGMVYTPSSPHWAVSRQLDVVLGRYLHGAGGARRRARFTDSPLAIFPAATSPSPALPSLASLESPAMRWPGASSRCWAPDPPPELHPPSPPLLSSAAARPACASAWRPGLHGWLHCNLQNSPAAACLHCARGAVLTSASARAEDSGGATGAVSSRRGLLRRTLRLGTAHVWAAHTARRRATSNSTG